MLDFFNIRIGIFHEGIRNGAHRPIPHGWQNGSTNSKESGMLWRSLLFLACSALTACANRQSLDASGSTPGVVLFRINCAGCHGTDARGNGPIAEFIQSPVPDLTRIAARNGGDFPTERVFQVIDGSSASSAHGTRHMPVWGYEFFGEETDDAAAHRDAIGKVDRLVEYLRFIQQPEKHHGP
jgi:mono/diheme cytochrome c family protein